MGSTHMAEHSRSVAPLRGAPPVVRIQAFSVAWVKVYSVFINIEQGGSTREPSRVGLGWAAMGEMCTLKRRRPDAAHY